jgi:putative oxidoreductase
MERSRGLNIGLWVVSALLGALYVFASSGKLLGDPQAVEGFRNFGYSDGFRLFIGAAELSGGVALLIPRLAFWAACGLVIIMFGALYTTLGHGLVKESIPAWVALAGLIFVILQRRREALFLS